MRGEPSDNLRADESGQGPEGVLAQELIEIVVGEPFAPNNILVEHVHHHRERLPRNGQITMAEPTNHEILHKMTMSHPNRVGNRCNDIAENHSHAPHRGILDAPHGDVSECKTLRTA